MQLHMRHGSENAYPLTLSGKKQPAELTAGYFLGETILIYPYVTQLSQILVKPLLFISTYLEQARMVVLIWQEIFSNGHPIGQIRLDIAISQILKRIIVAVHMFAVLQI